MLFVISRDPSRLFEATQRFDVTVQSQGGKITGLLRDPWTSLRRSQSQTFLQDGCVRVCSVTKLCPALFNSWGVAHQAPLSVGFPRQGYWNGLLFPPPGDLPNPGIKATSPALAGGFLYHRTTWQAQDGYQGIVQGRLNSFSTHCLLPR